MEASNHICGKSNENSEVSCMNINTSDNTETLDGCLDDSLVSSSESDSTLKSDDSKILKLSLTECKNRQDFLQYQKKLLFLERDAEIEKEEMKVSNKKYILIFLCYNSSILL